MGKDWLRSAKICEKSIRFFEKPKIAAIKTFSKRIAQDNILGHLKKAYHNLDLANKVFNIHEDKASYRYEGENYFDWVITICYYAMYQASLAALAAVRKEGETHAATCKEGIVQTKQGAIVQTIEVACSIVWTIAV